MKFIRVLLKGLVTLILIPLFFIVASLINLIFFAFDFKRRKVLTKWSAFCSKLYLKLIGFRLRIEGPLPRKGALIIGNHMSYLDILIFLSFFESLFVTSVEMKERFFLGQITQLAGCLFVERRNPRKLHEEMKTIKKYFSKGFNVCIFPEGTSSNGESVLPFKKSLFQIPVETHCPIQPIILKYESIDGLPFGNKTRDKVCWYGDMGFFSHLFNLLALKSVSASLRVLPTVDSSKFNNRKVLAEQAHRLVLKHYHL